MRNLKIFITVVFSFMLAACGSLGSKYNKGEIQKVKRVAVLSFTIYQDKPTDNLGLGALTKGISSDSTSENSPEMKSLAKAVYADLSKSLQKGLNKKVYPLKNVRGNSKYAQLYKEKMGGGFKMGGYHGDNVELVFVEGILDQTNFQGLPFAKKVEMAKSVGADAFIEFNASQKKEQSFMSLGHLTGSGDFAFKTRSNITMYSIYSEEPIWRVQNVDGEVSRNSKKVKGTQMEKLALIGRESAQSSIKAVFQTLKE